MSVYKAMNNFPKNYNFKESERKLQQFWYKSNVYQWSSSESRSTTYVIDTPPPTVSGRLHIGHVYSYTHTDFIARFKRMIGMNVYYPIGFDDNGLPTERLVEKNRKVRASSMKREEFIKICQEVVESEEEKFRDLFKGIALSVDWELEYQTINPTSRKISQMSFLDLVKKGQVYRDSQPILWDPVDQTALAQADIEDKTRASFMNDIEFVTDKGEQITIATTRPELLPACVAVFFHPDDSRYKHLAGSYAITPLFDVKVPLLADDLVDQEKGTGLVMCCTFGDQTDMLWWRKHKLPCKIILTKYGTICNFASAGFDENCQDLSKAEQFFNELTSKKVADARNHIIELLNQNGKLIKQAEITQTVKCAERSGAPLEIITTAQWFVKTIDHKDALLKRSAELNWFPKSMKIKLDSWIESITWDWCISRQRYFGVPFPVWYSKRPGEEGKPIFASPEQLPVDPMQDLPVGYSRDEVEPDVDVMDTWSTSSVSPQLNSHGISSEFSIDQDRHAKLFSADLRPQAHEIIRTWAFYTILKAHLHENSLPWKNIMISGWCLAEDKSKMSKSKGNIIVPETILEQSGADVIRYWSASSRLGADTAYSEDVIKNGKRLVNKLWNAAKFVSQHFDKLDNKYKVAHINDLGEHITNDYDKFFLSELQQLVATVTEEFNNYEYAHAMLKLEQFFWAVFCDNYLEITKTRAYNEDGSNNKGQLSALITLYHSLNIILKLFAPVVPHITEEIYQLLYSKGESIHIRNNWPKLSQFNFDDSCNVNSVSLLEILELVRKAKAAANLSIKAPVEIIEVKGVKVLPENIIIDLMNVTSSNDIKFVDKLTEDQSLDGEDISIYIKYVESSF